MSNARLTQLTASIVAACLGAGALGAPIPESMKFIDDNAHNGDHIGFTVLIDGGIMAVGAPLRDGCTQPAGQSCTSDFSVGGVYLFDTESMDLIDILLPDDWAARDSFSQSMDMRDGLLAAGSPVDEPRGSAYLFDLSTGQQLFKMLPGAGALEQRFGQSIAFNEQHIVVGAPSDDTSGTGSGSAYVFDAQTGQQLHKLLPSTGAQTQFGFSVHIDGNTIAVSSGFVEPYTDIDSGAIHLFDAATGKAITQLTSDDISGPQGFGYALDVDDGIIAMGTSVYAQLPGAYLFDGATGNQIARIVPSGGPTPFGTRYIVDISDGRLVVGEWQVGVPGGGHVRVFDASTGAETAVLELPAGSIEQDFGYRVDIDGDRVVVATQGDRITTFGSAYIYDANTGERLADLIRSDNGQFGDGWGFSGGDLISVDDQILAIAAPFDDSAASNAGAIFIWDLSCPADLTGDGNVNFFDISEYIALFNAQDPAADLAEPFGSLNFFDISAYITLFNQGCP